jgi:hypothetical protein
MIAGQIDPFLLFIKVPAAIGGAFVGYVASGPVVRLLYRAAFHRPAPGWIMPLGKLAGGALFGAILFLLVSLGGNGGWGLFPGRGSGSGDGIAAKGESNGKSTPGKIEPPRERLDIELLGGVRITGEGRYYLLDKESQAKTLEEVEAAIKDRADKIEIHLLATDESVAKKHQARTRLSELLQRYRIPLVLPNEQ